MQLQEHCCTLQNQQTRSCPHPLRSSSSHPSIVCLRCCPLLVLMRVFFSSSSSSPASLCCFRHTYNEGAHGGGDTCLDFLLSVCAQQCSLLFFQNSILTLTGGLNLTHQYKDHHLLYFFFHHINMTAAPVPPAAPLFSPLLLTRSIVRSFSLAAERTDVSLSVRLSVSPPLLLSGCLHTAAVSAQLCFVVGEPSANTPASIS